MVSKLRVEQIETLDGLHTKNVSGLIDSIDDAEVTTSTGTQALSNIVEGTFNLKSKGAVGDGVTDDTTAIDSVLAATTDKVYVPEGAFVYNKVPAKEDLYKLYGDGVLKFKGGQTDFSKEKITDFPLMHKTVSVTLSTADYTPEYQGWFDGLSRQGADIILVVTANLSDGANGHTFERLPEAKITDFITQAEANGLRIVMLKPHVVINNSDSISRSLIQPTNEQLHMANWKTELEYYGSLCDTHDIPYLCMSCEQPHQSKASLYSNWVDIVDSLNTLYPSLLLTAAYTLQETKYNLGFYEEGSLCQANLLDVYGQNVYPNYTSKVYEEVNGVPNITLDEVKKGLYSNFYGKNLSRPEDDADYIPKMKKVLEYFGKDLYITEIGAMDRTDSLISVISPVADVQTYKTQALLIRATMETLATMYSVIGVGWWHVRDPFNYFEDINTTVAEEAMTEYFAGGKV